MVILVVGDPGPEEWMRAISGHGLVTDATDWALRNVTSRNFSDVFSQVSGLGGMEQHHSAWWSRNIKWKAGNEPDYFG